MADLGFIGNIFNPSGGTAATTQPTGTNVYQTNIPEYAQPYVQNMMNATQAQIFQTDASGNVTGFNPYQPYTGMTQDQYNNASQAVAGFSPLQQQAQSAAANLQTPGQYGTATNLATASGLGALGTTGQAGMYGGMGARAGQQAAGQSNMYGGLGAMAGQQGAQIGQSLGQMSTDPNAVASYMNPYIQNALNPALQLSNQQYGMMGQQEQANATKAGAFGGSREALMAGLNQQNQMLANNQLIGNAYNTAFGQAQQQMNAANQAALSGNAQALQGYGMGLQGAGQAGQMGIAGSQAGLAGVGAQQAGYGQAGAAGTNLANIGGQQLAAQQGILNTQAQQGALQQANAQQVINQGIQNYATAQQYPLMELGTMSNMLHGLPMQAATTQQYQAAPSALNQAVGVAGVAGTLGSIGKKAGGLARGIKGYAVGGVISNTQSDLESMPTDALQKEMQTTQSPTIKNQIKQILQARAGAQYAGGGIIAFKDSTKENNESLVQDSDKKELYPGQQRDAAMYKGIGGFFSDAARNIVNPTKQVTDAANSLVNWGQTPLDQQARDFRSASARTEQAANPNAYVPPPAPPAAPPAAPSAAQNTDWQGSANVATQPSPKPSATPPGAITNATPQKPVNVPAIVAKSSYDKAVETGKNPNIPGFLATPSEEEKDKLSGAYRKKLEAYLGPDDSETQLARLDKRLERETKMYDRNEKLAYASMWAKIGSTPGSLVQATLIGIQHAIPQLITNDEKRNQALNFIDDAKTAVNKAKRAEALQKWDSAEKHTSEATKNILEANKVAAQVYGNTKQYEAAMYGHQVHKEVGMASAAAHAESNKENREARKDAKLRDQLNVVTGQQEKIRKDNKDIYDLAYPTYEVKTPQMKAMQENALKKVEMLEKEVRANKARIENEILGKSGSKGALTYNPNTGKLE